MSVLERLRAVKVMELSRLLEVQVGPTAMLVPERAAQDEVLGMDRMEGNTIFMYPEEVKALAVVIEKTYDVSSLTEVIVAVAVLVRVPEVAVMVW